MRACVFSNNLAMMVNRCQTQEISIQRGSKQGKPLPPFFFPLLAEGLSDLVTMDKMIGVYSGFKVRSSSLVVSPLKYADDTLPVAYLTIEIYGVLRRY